MWISQIRRRNRAWLRRHSYSFFSSLGVLLHHRIGTLMTVMVLGIAMFFPLGLYVTLTNLESRPGPELMNQSIPVNNINIRRFGDDVMIEGYIG